MRSRLLGLAFSLAVCSLATAPARGGGPFAPRPSGGAVHGRVVAGCVRPVEAALGRCDDVWRHGGGGAGALGVRLVNAGSEQGGTAPWIDRDALGRALGRAVHEALKAFKVAPDRAAAYRASAAAKRERGDTEGAIADYTEAIRLDPRSAEAFFMRGFTRRDQGDWKGAVVDYTEAIRLDPRHADAHATRANAKRELGDLRGARADADEAIRIDPQNLLGFNNRGIIRYVEGDFAGAIADLTQAIRIDPQFARAWLNRGNARSDSGDIEGGLADYSEAIRLAPGYSAPRIGRASTRRAAGDLQGALEDYLVAFRLTGDHGVLANLCVTRFRLGQKEEAMLDCRRARRRAPVRDAWPFAAEAGVLLLGGDLAGAEAALEEGLGREPEDGHALCLRALLHAKRNGVPEEGRRAFIDKHIGPWWEKELREMFGDDLFR